MGYNDSFEAYVKGRILSVISTDGKQTVDFSSGYVSNFSDSYNPTYQSQGIFGNSDPFRQYTNTERAINVSIVLIAGTWFAAQRNLEDTSKLVQFTYPIYEKTPNGSLVLSGRPEVRVKLMNLITNHTSRQHLPGYITNLNIDWDLADGVFEEKRYNGGGEVYPKYLNISFTFLPLHTQVLGTVVGESKSGDKDTLTSRMGSFPYGIGAKKEVKQEEQKTSAVSDAATEEQKEAAENRNDNQKKKTNQQIFQDAASQ